MAISIVKKNEFDAELLKLGIKKELPTENVAPQEITPQTIVKDIERGRPIGKTEVPVPVREFIAQEALSGVPAKELSELTKVSQSSISAYKVGATSTASYNNPEPELESHVRKIKINIASKARGKLLTAIDSLTEEKINGAKAKDIASIAKDMAAVVKSLDDKADNENESGPKVQFVFFAPKIKDESSFPIVEVSD